ncbi:porin [Caballeronia sp. GAFFF2]|uniref:porin n=1 Tax=Caballeronia sp. GAFFF2 TaxID=2921741 RepID=UPI00202792FA|nr:porin [Caballeronia sp. GAFFF2]
MKKAFLTALMTSAGVSLAHAESSVTLYGIVDDGIQYFNHVGVAQSTGAKGKPVQYTNKSSLSIRSGALYADRWGLQGKEDLGGGLKAIFQLENGFNINTGAFASSGNEFNRQAFVGVTSDRFGTLTMGRQYEPMTDLLLLYGNDFGSGSGTYPGDISNLDDSIRVNNSIKYQSPNYRGMTADVLYGFGNNAGSLNSGSTVSAGMNYVQGPLALGAAYLRMVNTYGVGNAWSASSDGNYGSSPTAGFIGSRMVQIVGAVAQYTIGKLTVGTNYGYTQYRPPAQSSFAQSVAYNSVGAGAKYFITPALRVGGSVAYTRGQPVTSTAERAQYENIAGNALYLLSKRTGLYLIVAYQHAKGQMMDAYGNVIGATSSIGDSANGNSSGSGNQFMVRAGFETHF